MLAQVHNQLHGPTTPGRQPAGPPPRQEPQLGPGDPLQVVEEPEIVFENKPS